MPEYMQAAAEKAIRDLQNQVDAAEESAARAETFARRAESQASHWKKLTVAAIALIVVVAGLGSGLFFGLQHQAINSCKIGNDRAAGFVVTMDELVTLLEGPHPSAKTMVAAKNFEAYITAHNQQRDCSKAYSVIP